MNSTQNKEKSSSCNSAVNQRTICQVEIIDFTEDKDLILKVEKGTKDDELELIYVLRKNDPSFKIGEKLLVEILLNSDHTTVTKINFINKINENISNHIGIYKKSHRGNFVYSIQKGSRKKWLINPKFESSAMDDDIVEIEDRPQGSFKGKKYHKIRNIIGNLNENKSLSLLAIKEHNIPYQFSNQIINEASKIKDFKPNQQNLKNLFFVTIDPTDARDHDDAVYAMKDTHEDNPNGYIIWVAIADVAQYVKIGSSIDIEARLRGNSTYFVDRVIPMLPENLSNNLCSLKENMERPCIAVKIRINSDGEKLEHNFFRGTMVSKASLGYKEVQDAYEGKISPKTEPLYKPVLETLFLAFEALLKSKNKRQPLELNLPEREILLSEKGEVQSINLKKQLSANKLIEEFMVLANICAAETLSNKKVPAIYRIHEEPTLEKINALNETIRSIDLNLKKLNSLKTADLNQLLKLASTTDHSNMINLSILRTMTQAYYSNKLSAHFGLNLQKYAHFTSPIRRYADLIVHRALIATHNWDTTLIPADETSDLGAIARHISLTERRSMSAERDTIDRYLARFLKDKIGGEFYCLISGITRFGIFIQLDEIGADGLIPLSNLGSEYYKFDENENSLTGKASKTKIKVGMSARVSLLEADETSGGLRFKLIELNGQLFDKLVSHKKLKKKKYKLRRKKRKN